MNVYLKFICARPLCAVTFHFIIIIYQIFSVMASRSLFADTEFQWALSSHYNAFTCCFFFLLGDEMCKWNSKGTDKNAIDKYTDYVPTINYDSVPSVPHAHQRQK